MGESAKSTDLADLAKFANEQAGQSFIEKRTKAGLHPLREIYYTYLRELHKEPEDVYEMFKGYTYILFVRGQNG